MKRGWLVVAATVFMALLAISCGGSKPAVPDKVVGVLLKCTMPAQEDTRISSGAPGYFVPGEPSSGAGGYFVPGGPDISIPYVVPAAEHSGDFCQWRLDAGDKNYVVRNFNMRYFVTVRTLGGGYTVEVPATTTVAVGQVWPPTP